MNEVLVNLTIINDLCTKIEIIKVLNCDIIIVLKIQNLRIPYAHIANGKPVY